MPERQFDAKPVLVDYLCDECAAGTMRFAGEMPSPKQFLHRCSNCSHEVCFPSTYPATLWVAISETSRDT